MKTSCTNFQNRMSGKAFTRKMKNGYGHILVLIYSVLRKDISRSELQGLMEPKDIYEGTPYFSAIIKTAEELKIIENKDNIINLLDGKERFKTIDDFRRYVISILQDLSDGQFWKCTNAIVNMNEKIYEHNSIADSGMLNHLSSQLGETASTTVEIR